MSIISGNLRYSKIRKYVYTSSGNKHPTDAGEVWNLAPVLMYRFMGFTIIKHLFYKAQLSIKKTP